MKADLDSSRCEKTDLIRYSCAHCTGRWGDEDMQELELW